MTTLSDEEINEVAEETLTEEAKNLEEKAEEYRELARELEALAEKYRELAGEL